MEQDRISRWHGAMLVSIETEIVNQIKTIICLLQYRHKKYTKIACLVSLDTFAHVCFQMISVEIFANIFRILFGLAIALLRENSV